MDRTQYGEWAADFARRFPEAGMWLGNLPDATRDCWFKDVFSRFELEDALAMNRKMMLEGTLSKWERDKFISIVIDLLQQVGFDRAKRKQELQEKQNRTSGAGAIVRSDPVMGSMYRQVTRRMREWRRDNPGATQEELVSQWAQDASDEFDHGTDEIGRYQCPLCLDTGYISTKIADKKYAAACSCNKGAERFNQWADRGKHIARGAGPAIENEFNDALAEL